jgi:hypothetical protein
MKYSLLAVLSLLLFVPTASATTYQANTSNYTSVVNAAVAGDVVELASGTYGFTTQHPSGLVTVHPASGATVTGSLVGDTTTANLKLDNFNSFAGADINGSTNVTISHTNFTQSSTVYGHSVNVNFDNDVFNNLGQSGNEGRLGYMNGSTGTVSNNVFSGSAGCSDGLMVSGGGGSDPNVTITGNEFKSIREGSCVAHADPLSFYGGQGTVTDNYFHDNSTGIMSPDGNGHFTVRNNVFVTDGEYPNQIVIGGGNGDVIDHNVFAGGAAVRIGAINVGFSSNETVTNNVLEGGLQIDPGQSTSTFTISNNPSSQTYAGGTGRCAYAPATSSTAGLTDCGSPPPPVACNDGVDNDSDGLIDYPNDPGCTSATDTDETNTVDHTPVARFTASPEPSNPNQQVTFNATTSTCDDTPCTYTWTDEPPGGGVFALGTGSTLNFTFQATGTKYVNLVVQDADGDTNRVEHDHVVSAADTTPPDTNITANPTNPTTSTNASFSFTSTETGSTFECKLDAGAYGSCTSPKAYSSLATGSHTFSVRATDAASNTDPTPATYTWTINAVSVTAPTFITEAETSWGSVLGSSNPKVSISFTVNAGDVIVAYGMTEDQPYALSISGGTGLTWTEKQQVNAVGYGRAYVWTTTVGTGQTMHINCSRSPTTGTAAYGCDALVFRGSTGVGTTAKANASGAPSLTMTTVSDNSAEVKAVVDWSALSGASRNSLTTGVGAFTEQTYQQVTSVYTVYGGYHANVGTAGSKTVGYSAPTGQKYSIVAAEVKGT